MPRYKYYDYKQTVMIPIELEKQIIAGTLEYAIHKLVEERVKIEPFEKKLKNDETGRPAYDPKVMLKIILLAYSKGIISSRKIEQACKENIVFMALSCQQYPDHSKIAELISEHQSEDKKEDKKGDKKEEKNEKRKSEDKEKIQLERLRRKAKKIEKWLKENEPKIGKQGKEVKSNIIDNDSCKMSTSSGVIQGYNGQALNHYLLYCSLLLFLVCQSLVHFLLTIFLFFLLSSLTFLTVFSLYLQIFSSHFSLLFYLPFCLPL